MLFVPINTGLRISFPYGLLQIPLKPRLPQLRRQRCHHTETKVCKIKIPFSIDTGLPPSRPAMVYYNYGLSQDWPQFNAGDPTKAGGRCVVAPFFYRYDHPFMAPDAPYKLPQFFDNTLISADWFRSVSSGRISVPLAFRAFQPNPSAFIPDSKLSLSSFQQPPALTEPSFAGPQLVTFTSLLSDQSGRSCVTKSPTSSQSDPWLFNLSVDTSQNLVVGFMLAQPIS
jgi:hypothetical protein